MVSQCTKYEVSRFTRYKAMNGSAKCRKWGVLGHSRSSAMSPFDRVHTNSFSTLIETMRLSCTVFEIYPVICRDIAGYLSKVADFYPPHLHSAPPQGVTLFAMDFRLIGSYKWYSLLTLVTSCSIIRQNMSNQTKHAGSSLLKLATPIQHLSTILLSETD